MENFSDQEASRMLYEMLCFRSDYVFMSDNSVFTLNETLRMSELQDLD